MKKFAAAMMLALTLGAAGCRSSTEYGECHGLFDEDAKRPDLRYEVSTRNVVLGVLFSETLLWPVVTAGWYVWCPVGKK